MKLVRRWFSFVALFICAATTVVACAGGNTSGDVIRVGSKDFAEQLILGEMYALMLEDAGYAVERKLNLGGTPVAQAALESNEIDLYPEYTGTGLLTVLKEPVSSDPNEVFDTVSSQYQEQFNLVWLTPAPMNNTQALAMTRERSDELGITTISEFAEQANNLTLIGPPEFEVREDGLPGIQSAYGDFQLKEYKAVDQGLRYKGLVDGEADVAVAFGTDGEISAFDLVVLEDDQQLFPPYQVAPVVRQEALDATPEIETILNELSPAITDEVMQTLNYAVTGEEREPEEVAQTFLVENGFLEETDAE
ncbi:glycine betaine ABC transporter substrate-binding protein [Oscillatoria sp. CS-180]|uniref:glycine betaine ABC transporter substrate-binding protein n=1 Tax=Oscillatoria sp. CS-180 TaxID=3021720 RepID=UPI00232EE237|nr:glycine betaine ABC transporter substrate-binding protein [Oscillatoria sp. CS-180]MDB9528286.1 glycine betaine ABC transporter substrate-binding protein [Oscillatoria sp. CS-180]